MNDPVHDNGNALQLHSLIVSAYERCAKIAAAMGADAIAAEIRRAGGEVEVKSISPFSCSITTPPFKVKKAL